MGGGTFNKPKAKAKKKKILCEREQGVSSLLYCLQSEPHTGYRLVSVVPLDDHQEFLVIWERKGK